MAGEDLAAGVRAVLGRPERARRAAARARAERFDWATAVRGFLAVHAAGQTDATQTGHRDELEVGRRPA